MNLIHLSILCTLNFHCESANISLVMAIPRNEGFGTITIEHLVA